MSGDLKLNNVVLSYANLVEPRAFQQGDEASYSARFMIDPDSEEAKSNLEAIKKAVAEVKEETWPGPKKPSLGADRLCYGRMPDDDDRFPGWYFVRAREKEDYPPTLVANYKDASGKWHIFDRDTERQEALKLFYSGAHANVVLRLWGQDNSWGKRINCHIRAVQFREHGERLSGFAPVDADEVFSDDDIPESGSIADTSVDYDLDDEAPF